jgi:hypothetical protein
LIDNVSIGTDTFSPYAISWDSTTVSNGSHSITVRPTNVSGPDTTITVNVNNGSQGAGNYTAEYFNNQTLSGTPTTTLTESAINHDWSWNSPINGLSSDHFSVRWTGTFTFEAAKYRFNATTDDGIRFFIDGNPILFTTTGKNSVSAWKDQPATTYNVLVNMTAGTHTIKVEFYENAGQAVAKFNFMKHSSSCYDMDADGTITDNDLGVIADHYGLRGPNLPWSVNGDNIVSSADIGLVANKRGTSCP